MLLAAQGVIGKRIDQMESGFMMALDYMINLAEKDQDDKVFIQIKLKKSTFFSTQITIIYIISAQVSVGGNQGNNIIPSYQKMPPTCKQIYIFYQFTLTDFYYLSHKIITFLFFFFFLGSSCGSLCRTPWKESRHDHICIVPLFISFFP